MRRAIAVVGATLLLLGPAACGGSDDGGTALGSTVPPGDVTTVPAAKDLPPEDALDLESVYGDQLKAIGMELTDRGGLIDRTGGGYEQSPHGTHLAVYVRPTGDRTLAEYIDGIQEVTAIFAQSFDRWPGLKSFDVCQEPVPSSTPNAYGTKGEPLPVTQVEMTREQADAIDFDTATVTDLVRLSRARPHALELRVGSAVARAAAYRAIFAAATAAQ